MFRSIVDSTSRYYVGIDVEARNGPDLAPRINAGARDKLDSLTGRTTPRVGSRTGSILLIFA